MKILCSFGIVIGLAVIFYAACLNHVGINEVGVAYNSYNGDLVVQTNAGWYVTTPLTKVVTLSTLPQQVGLGTYANVIAVKIVKLRKDHVIDFVKLQGFSYELKYNFDNILMGYAFCGKTNSFLEVVQDATPANNQ